MDHGDQPGPSPLSVLFARGVIARLHVWATLRIAVQESWGGPEASEKRTWLASEIVDAFEEQNPPPDEQYVEEMLLQVMSDEFEVVVEDGSTESVARDIVRIWDETRTGKTDYVRKFEELADEMKGKSANVQAVQADEEEEWEDEEEDDESTNEVPMLIDRTNPKPKEEPEVDDEGFTLVKSKGKSHR